jgi:hypothetical protein
MRRGLLRANCIVVLFSEPGGRPAPARALLQLKLARNELRFTLIDSNV